MNIFKFFVILTLLNNNTSFSEQFQVASDDQILFEIYQTCPNLKKDLTGFPAGIFSYEAKILLAILASRDDELQKCPRLAGLNQTLSRFDNCIVQAHLKDLLQSSANDQNRQFSLALKQNAELVKKREQEIRQHCQLEISRLLAKR